MFNPLTKPEYPPSIELEELLRNVAQDPNRKPELIHMLHSSYIYVEGRAEADNTRFRFYPTNRSDGSVIIDVYTSIELFRQAKDVNLKHCLRITGFQLLHPLRDHFVCINYGSAYELELSPKECLTFQSPSTLSDRVKTEASAQVKLEMITACPTQWIRPIANLCNRFSSAKAAYLGLLIPDENNPSNRLHLLVAIKTAKTDDFDTMANAMINMLTDMILEFKFDINLRLMDGTEEEDDLALRLTQQSPAFYIQSKTNQWRRKLGLPPTLSVKTY